MKIFFLYFFILFFLSCSNTKTIKIDLENEIIIPKTYNVFKTSEKIQRKQRLRNENEKFHWFHFT